MNSSAQCERVNRTVFGARDFEVLNVTFAIQEALIWDRAIEPRVKGLGAQWERKRLFEADRAMNHVARD